MQSCDDMKSLLVYAVVFMFATDETLSLHYRRRSDEEMLLEFLFQGYNPAARPVLNSSKSVDVNIQFSLLQIQELNIRSQVLTTTGLLILDWIDERLTWNKEVSELTDIVIDGGSIWKPEFAIINGAEMIYENYNEFQAVLHHDGRLRWEPGGIFKTMCHIDITYYPFDEQKCDLTFGSWAYYTNKMNITTNKDKINLDTYEKNGEWKVIDTNVNRDEFFFACCPDQRFAYVDFAIYIKRKHTFYIMNVILPGILTSAVLLSIFFCTPSQKMHIGVAALLSFRLFLLNVADTIPRTSDHVPLLGIYLSCTMAITTMAMVTTVFVLNLYSSHEKPVPRWVKRLLLDFLAPLLCMCICTRPVRGGSGANTSEGRRSRRSRQTSRRHTSDDTQPTSSTTSPIMSSSGTRQRVAGVGGGSCNPPNQNASRIRRHALVGRRPAHSGADAKQWVYVATVCDRLFFWICLICIVITTMILFHPLMFKDTIQV